MQSIVKPALFPKSFCYNWHPPRDLKLEYFGAQIVRWRKPRWLPTAPSKMFRVPKRCVIPKEEVVEIQRIYNNYRTNMRSIRSYLKEQNMLTSATSQLAAQHAQEEEDEHQCLMLFNLEENKRVQKLREARQQKELEEDLERVARSLVKLELKEKHDIEAAQSHIEKTQELVRSLLTHENLEEAIEKALENPINYNFALDQDGNIHASSN
ncbi:mitochondrial ribosomal protein S26 [Oratosquilla oratoria]|uniref:mitochondrial ribosomal protein S26 n=1 Tax=Oratosquilla oratoria TaxID=337810 RepID=UPI003F758178